MNAWYWYKPNATTWLRCVLKGKTLTILTLEIIQTGQVVSGVGRRVGMDFVLDAK